jgi:hypothetical protein
MPDTREKIVIRKTVDVTDPEYFCNKSWTLSFNMNTKSWISFHSYIPNWYIAENNFFYSGLNGGVDLEAIAVVEVPYVPTTSTTSSSTTKCKTCKPVTTSTTTTATPDCTIDGYVTVLDCTIEGVAYDITPLTTTSTTSTTTTFNCTTSTTTTVCPSCGTYIINNPTEEIKTATITDCNTGATVEVNVDFTYYSVCSCADPVVPAGLSFTYYSAGCLTCFCYTLTNNTLCDALVQYMNCDGDIAETTLGSLATINICVKDKVLAAGPDVTVTGGTSSCTINDDCNP